MCCLCAIFKYKGKINVLFAFYVEHGADLTDMSIVLAAVVHSKCIKGSRC